MGRGLTISDRQQAIKILSRENYYRLINGYKDLFLLTSNPSERYKSGASLSEIHALYRFDEELKAQLLRVFLIIENNLKSFLAYEFAKAHGACEYLNVTNYNYITQYQSDINKLVSKIQGIITQKFPHGKRLQHYQNKHNGKIPLWVIINLLTLGNVSRFYKYLQLKVKIEIARRFSMKSNHVNNYFNNITLARNICAHGERFYNFKLRTGLNILPEHTKLKILFPHENPEVGSRDLFAVLLM